MSEWKPIDKYKGGEVLFYQPAIEGRTPMGCLNERCVVDNSKPHRLTTHWMPLPKPPEAI